MRKLQDHLFKKKPSTANFFMSLKFKVVIFNINQF